VPDGKINALHLELRAFIGGTIQCQKMIIKINGNQKSESCLSSFENNSILIPLSAADYAPGTPLVIDFSLPNAMSPKSIGVSESDDRVLAIGLKQAVFK
jgi:hypothetical protein